MPDFSITLSNTKNETFELRYRLNETPAALIWFNSLKKAQQHSHLLETRLYDFPNNQNLSLQELLKQFDLCFLMLSKQFPEILNSPLILTTPEALQESLNILHRNFAHNHLVEQRISNENQQIWHEFNLLIHKIESALISAKYPPAADGLSRSRIEFCWKSPFITPIPENCYGEFTLQREFGDLHNVYTQVGRNILELYYASDDNVPLEHIRPFRFFSANAGLYFGPRVTAAHEEATLIKIQKWFKKNETMLAAAGVYWSRPDRALGAVNMARLIDRPESLSAMKELQKKICQFDTVAAIAFGSMSELP